ncbi:MAG: thiamine ABC transporter substrate-binding protein [Candidatus Bipolaricaulota bacterium]
MRLMSYLLCALVLLAVGLTPTAEELLVYTYDSFVAWGPAQEIKEEFEEAHPGVELVWIAPGDSSEMLSRLIGELELGLPTADVFLGVADVEVHRALEHEAFLPLETELIPNLEYVPEDIRLDEDAYVVPYDYGYVTFVYDDEALPAEHVPETLEDLLRPALKDKIILQDPRTSSPGLSFLLWTIAHFGEEWTEFWRQLRPNVLTVTTGWTESFEMFQAGEAPIVISYATDEAYSYIVHGDLRYRVLTPGGEGYRQVEYMGVVRTTDNPKLAHTLLNIVLSHQVQELIPTSQWMFPANEDADTPADFQEYAIIPENPVALDLDLVAENLEEWISEWQAILVGS